MRFKGFIGASYKLQSVNVDAQRCINLYPEQNEMGTGIEGEEFSLVSTPGLQLLCTLPTGPVRGNYTDSNNNLWAVGGNVLYSVSSTWVATPTGTLLTSVGPVSFSDNGTQLVLVDGPYGYSLTLGSVSTPSNTLTSASNTWQVFTGSINQLLILPPVQTLAINQQFIIQNTGTATITVQAADGAVISAPASQGGAASLVGPGQTLIVQCNSNIPGGLTPWTSNYITNSLSTVTNGGSVNMTATSSPLQILTGNNTENVVLPPVNTLTVGQCFVIQSNSSGAVAVGTSDFASIQSMSFGSILILYCLATTPNGAAVWESSYITTQSTIATPAGETSTFSQIMDTSFQGATQVSFMDGYFIFSIPNSGKWILSPLDGVTPFNALDSAVTESSPNILVGQMVCQENLYLFGPKSIEVWYDSGANDFPFERIQGGVIQVGCEAAFSIQLIGNMIYWLGQDQNGRGTVYSIAGYQPKRISTLAIENVIANLGDLSGARAFAYQQAGHTFYCLNLPGSKTTWCFDTTNGLWHERAYFSGGQFSRHLADCHALAYNTNVVGDYSSGNLYAFSQSVFTDNGELVARDRISPHIAKDTDRVFYSRFILDMERGTGLTGGVQGSNPQAMLRWSNDGGHSWSNEHWTSCGPIGVRKPRVMWRRLGQSRDRVYWLRITDPVKVTLLGADLDLDEGAA